MRTSPHLEARTRTGLLEGHLEAMQAVERLGWARLQAPQAPGPEERELALKTIRLAVGLQRVLRRWIARRVAEERNG